MRFTIIFTIVVSILLIGGISIAQNDSKQLSEKPKEIIGKDGAPMVLIPAGEFQMGSNDVSGDEKPVHMSILMRSIWTFTR